MVNLSMVRFLCKWLNFDLSLYLGFQAISKIKEIAVKIKKDDPKWVEDVSGNFGYFKKLMILSLKICTFTQS